MGFTRNEPSSGTADIGLPSTNRIAAGFTLCPVTMSFFAPLYFARVIAGIVAGSTRLISILAAELPAPWSRTATVNVNSPATAGTPEINPEDGLRLKPAGNAPDVTDQMYAGIPPFAVSWKLNDDPISPLSAGTFPIARGCGATVIVRALLAV